MTDIKDRLARLSALAKGPELIWPHMSDVADAAIARIEELEEERDVSVDPSVVQDLINAAEPAMAEALAALEADNARLQARVRFLERKIVSNG
jgi:hypothetical protein